MLLLLTMAVVASGCGGAAYTGPPLTKRLTVLPGVHTVAVRYEELGGGAGDPITLT